MPIITEIKRRAGLYAIMCGEEELALLSSDIFAHSQVHCGAELTPGEELNYDDAQLLQRLSDTAMAREKALSLVARRELCRTQLVRKLSDAGYDAEVCHAAADEMERLGFIDDERYAQMCAEYYYEIKGFGRRRVERELVQKGVGRELAAQAAYDAQPDPAEALERVIREKYARSLSDEKGRRRCVNALMRMGYDYSDIRTAVGDAEDDFDVC